MNHSSVWLAGFLLGLYAAAPLAHHSASISYDIQSEIVHENVPVVEWRFANPHAQLVFEAPTPMASLPGGARRPEMCNP